MSTTPPQPHNYLQPIVARAAGATFAGRTLTTTVKAGAFTATSQETITGVNMAADYSVQQNIFAAEHFYQNCLIQNTGGLVWHLECFEPNGTLPNGKPSFPADGQFYKSTDPAGVVPSSNPWGKSIPAGIDLRTGGYTVQFYAQDDGSSTISLRCVILNGENQVYDSGWAVVTDAFMQPGVEAESGSWYDSLTAASIAIVGAGLGGPETGITFAGGPFNVSFDAGVPDLQAGGQYWYQGVPYEDPIEAALPGIGTAGTSNLTFPLANLDTQASIPTGPEASVNGYTGAVQLRTADTIEWDGSGLTDDEGGVAQFGVIPHGIDPAPQGAGFMVLDEKLVDDGALVRGTLAYTGALEAMLPDTRALNVVEGLVVDAYVYDNAASSPKGYSQAVVLTFTNVLAFVGSTD